MPRATLIQNSYDSLLEYDNFSRQNILILTEFKCLRALPLLWASDDDYKEGS